MSLFKRGMINIMRQPGKSAILLVLIFLLGTILSGAIAMRNAIIATESNLMIQMPPLSTMVFNSEASAEDAGVYPWERGPAFWLPYQPTREEIATVGNLPYVRAYDFVIEASFFSLDLAWAEMEVDEERLPLGLTLDSLAWSIGGSQALGGNIETFPGRGTNNPQITDIEADLINIVEGRTFTQEEIDHNAMVVVISRFFAESNALTLGTTFEVENIVHDYTTMGFEGTGNFIIDRQEERFILARQTLTFEVIGIFDITQEFVYEGHDRWIFESALNERAKLYNRIYMPIGIAEDSLNFVSDAMLETADELRQLFGDLQVAEMVPDDPKVDVIFMLYDPRDLDAFSVEANELLPEFWEIRDLRAPFNHVINSMDNMLQIADWIGWGTVGGSVVLLMLVILLFLRDRRHEIVIYMALGEKKIRVIAQILTEVVLIAMISIILSLFAGNILADTMSRQMLQQQLVAQMEEGINETDVIPWELTLFNPGSMDVEETMELYDVSLEVHTMLTFVSLAIGVVLLAVVIPILYVIKLEPKKNIDVVEG